MLATGLCVRFGSQGPKMLESRNFWVSFVQETQQLVIYWLEIFHQIKFGNRKLLQVLHCLLKHACDTSLLILEFLLAYMLQLLAQLHL